MWWAIVCVLAFLLVTGLVAALARAETSRWEDRHRAHVVPRPTRPGDPGRRLRGAARLQTRLEFGGPPDARRGDVAAAPPRRRRRPQKARARRLTVHRQAAERERAEPPR